MDGPFSLGQLPIEDELRFETMLADVSSRFINLPAGQVDSEIVAAQRRVCEHLGLDVSTLWQWDPDAPGDMTLTHYCAPPGVAPRVSRMDASEHFPWCLRQALDGKSVVVLSMDDLGPEAARDVATWREYGIKSSLTLPLSAGGGGVFGALSFNDTAKERMWAPALINRLALVAQVFANALARKQLEQSLQESEQRLVMANEAAGTGPWVLDSERSTFWTGGRLREMLGLAPGDRITVDEFLALIHADDRQAMLDTMAQAMQSPEMKTIEYRVVRPGGELRWMVSRARMCSRGGAAQGRLTGITTDITARKLAEQQMANGLRFETLIADLSTQFINLPAEKMDEAILVAQRRVCDMLGLHTSTLWQWVSEKPGDIQLTHDHRPAGGPPVPKRMDAAKYFPWAHRRGLAGELIAVPSTEDLPDEAALDRATWLHYGVKASLIVPLITGDGAVLGALSFSDMQATREWSEPLIRRVRLVAQIFANALARARADKTIRESESRLHLAADTAALGLWSLNLATGHFWVTDRTRQLFALQANEEITLERFLGVVHPEDRAFVRNRVESLVESKQEGRDEFRIIHPDGSVRWMLARGRVHCNAAGDAEVLTGVTVDITERRKAEDMSRLDGAVLEHMEEGVVLVSMSNQIIVHTNPTFDRLLGYEHGELVGQHIDTIHFTEGPRPSPLTVEIGESLYATGQWRGDVQNRRRDGTPMWSRVRLNMFHHPVYGPVGLSLHADITARRDAELETQRQRAQVAHLSRVTMLGELSGSLAHELNQPLAAILSNAQAAQRFIANDHVDPVELREILADIVAADTRAGEVIRRLRLLLKKEEIQLCPLDLNEVVADVLSLVRSDLLNHNVRLSTGFCPDLPFVLGDRVQLQQVLLNLIVNATEAMDQVAQDDRGLIVRTDVVDGAVCVSIADRGPGLPAEVLPRLYETFFTTKPSGLGMGLKVSRSIISAHGGQLTGGNNADGGATFTVAIPVHDRETA